ncbi:hypothetical protein ApDm4_2428 [Acetobacter pomorum]|nr:hypothetical protein ApDm4_2428 [Acetobacter pomorum]
MDEVSFTVSGRGAGFAGVPAGLEEKMEPNPPAERCAPA